MVDPNHEDLGKITRGIVDPGLTGPRAVDPGRPGPNVADLAINGPPAADPGITGPRAVDPNVLPLGKNIPAPGYPDITFAGLADPSIPNTYPEDPGTADPGTNGVLPEVDVGMTAISEGYCMNGLCSKGSQATTCGFIGPLDGDMSSSGLLSLLPAGERIGF